MSIRYAIMEGKSLDIIKEIIKNGALINPPNVNPLCNNLPLQEAVNYSRLDIAKYFIENGADVNIGHTSVLEIATENNNFEMVTYLVSKGAIIQNFNFESVFKYLDDFEDMEIIIYLLERLDDPCEVKKILNRKIHNNISEICQNKEYDSDDYDCESPSDYYNPDACSIDLKEKIELYSLSKALNLAKYSNHTKWTNKLLRKLGKISRRIDSSIITHTRKTLHDISEDVSKTVFSFL